MWAGDRRAAKVGVDQRVAAVRQVFRGPVLAPTAQAQPASQAGRWEPRARPGSEKPEQRVLEARKGAGQMGLPAVARPAEWAARQPGAGPAAWWRALESETMERGGNPAAGGSAWAAALWK